VHGLSLHAGVRCGAHQREQLERLRRYITRPALANEQQPWRNATDWYRSGPVTAGSGNRSFDLDFGATTAVDVGIEIA